MRASGTACFVTLGPIASPSGSARICGESRSQFMNKARQLLADIMLVVVLCVAAVMAELGTKRGDGGNWREFVVPTAGLGAVLIVGLLIMAIKPSKDAPTVG
jgi:hypothetical protein